MAATLTQMRGFIKAAKQILDPIVNLTDTQEQLAKETLARITFEIEKAREEDSLLDTPQNNSKIHELSILRAGIEGALDIHIKVSQLKEAITSTTEPI